MGKMGFQSSTENLISQQMCPVRCSFYFLDQKFCRFFRRLHHYRWEEQDATCVQGGLNEQVLLRVLGTTAGLLSSTCCVLPACLYVLRRSFYLSPDNSSAVRETFLKKKREQRLLKHDEMWELTAKKGIRNIS